MTAQARRGLHKVELGEDMVATFAWRPSTDRKSGIPSGILLSHGTRHRHATLIIWSAIDTEPRRVVEVLSLKPLTITDTLECAVCPLRGRIIDDRWVPDA